MDQNRMIMIYHNELVSHRRVQWMNHTEGKGLWNRHVCSIHHRCDLSIKNIFVQNKMKLIIK